jgi:hypothetical protein
MTVLSDFVTELAVELDRRRAGGPPLAGFPPHKWMDFCKLFTLIDRDQAPAMTELRDKLERIVEQTDVPFQKRARDMLPLLPMGSVQ